jgi:hypothetical protein
VWGIGLILSVSHAAAAYGKNELCYAVWSGNASTMFTGDFITLCVMPLLITAVFSGLTACIIRRSAREIPEATGQEQLQHCRMVSSTVLFALTFLIVVSYGPFYLFSLLTCVNECSFSIRGTNLVLLITHHLRFVNYCLNPIVVFKLSKSTKGT